MRLPPRICQRNLTYRASNRDDTAPMETWAVSLNIPRRPAPCSPPPAEEPHFSAEEAWRPLAVLYARTSCREGLGACGECQRGKVLEDSSGSPVFGC